ncbi:MAG: hypothetical protein IPH13_07690 [Planctomycetes bacterium]|nr:hypothetical protein [Planctomycetota bacterium]MCC7169409.1 hypothetical protein [Planctomycetota bacterium]
MVVSTFRFVAIANVVLGMALGAAAHASAAGVELEAVSLVLPGQANAGATIAASAEIRIVGDSAGNPVHLDVVWTDDAVLDAGDPVIGSTAVDFDGIHGLVVTLPAAATAGPHHVALRVVPFPDEIDRTDNVVFAAPIEILVPDLAFASNAPLAFAATSVDPDLAVDVAVINSGTPGSFGLFEIALQKPVTWLEVVGASGVAVAGSAPATFTVLVHAEGLVPGVYANVLLMTQQGAPHAVQALPVTLTIGAPWFVPGDRVRTTLAAGAARELRFDTLAGMKLALTTIELNKGARVESWVRPENYDPAEPVTVPHKMLKAVKKKVVLKTPTSGIYFLRLTNPTSSPVTIELATGRGLPKTALPRVATLRQAAPEITALLLPGATADATFLANDYVTGPLALTATCAAGSMSGLGQYTVLATPDALVLTDLPVPSGPYLTLRAENFGDHAKARVKVNVTPKQPALGTALIVLD